MTELRDSLAQVQELLGRATDGEWYVEPLSKNEFGQQTYLVNIEVGHIPTIETGEFYGDPNDANAVCAAMNFLRTHGPELMKMLDRHGAGDADRSAELTTAWMAGGRAGTGSGGARCRGCGEVSVDRAQAEVEDHHRQPVGRAENLVLHL